MNILDVIVNAQNGGAIQQLGNQFGLAPDQTQSVLSAIVPALASGLQNNMSSDQGLAGLASALSTGQHQRYLDNPASLADAATTQDGNGILGHVFGSKDVSRQVARQASEQTGVDVDILKKMLPVVATMVMGGLSRQAAASGTGSTGAGLMSMLAPVLDQNRDGSMIDDVLGMAGRFLGRRS